MFKVLFTPIRVGPMDLKNRIIMPAMHFLPADQGFLLKDLCDELIYHSPFHMKIFPLVSPSPLTASGSEEPLARRGEGFGVSSA